jgi:hypothetical protein
MKLRDRSIEFLNRVGRSNFNATSEPQHGTCLVNRSVGCSQQFLPRVATSEIAVKYRPMNVAST